MPFEMVHAQHRPLQSCPECAGHAGPHQQGPGQPRAAGIRDHVDLRQRTPGRIQHTCRVNGRTRRIWSRLASSGHDAAISLVHVDLAVQRMRQQGRHPFAARLHQRNTGLVTRGLDSQNQQIVGSSLHRSEV